MSTGRFLCNFLPAFLLLAGSASAGAVVVRNADQLVQAVNNQAPLIEVAGVIEIAGSYQGSDNALPIIDDQVVVLRGRPGAEIRAVADGFRFAEVRKQGELKVTNLTIRDFSSGPSGGALWIEGGLLEAGHVVFRGNESQLNGGAVQARLGSARIRVMDSLFEDNSAGRRGGAVSLHDLDSPAGFERNRFVNNQARFGCALSLVGTNGDRISNSVFRGTCETSLVDLDTNRTGPDLFNNTWVANGSMAFRYRPHGDNELSRARMAGNVLVQAGIGPSLCQGTVPGDGIESLGDNLATDASCDLDDPSDIISSSPSSVLADLDLPDPAADGPAVEVNMLPTAGTFAGEWRCGIADANGLGRPQDADGDAIPACDVGAVELRRGSDIGPTRSGAYFDPARNGEGYFVEMLGGRRALVSFYSYAPVGGSPPVTSRSPAWFTGVGRVVGNSIVIPEFSVTQGGAFGEAFNPSGVFSRDVAGLSLVFPGCASDRGNPGWAYFRSNELGIADVPVHSDLFTRAVRLSSIIDCGAFPAPAPSGRSGSFYDPTRNGEGISVQWLTDGRVVVIWHTFDPDGNQMWFISESSQVDGDTVTASMIYPAVSTAFGPDFDAGEIELEPWGTLTLEYRDCDNLELSYDSIVAGYGSGSHDYQRLTRLAGTECDL